MRELKKGLSLHGETENAFRKRQNLERQDSQQQLFGIDLELQSKTTEKMTPEIVQEACEWVFQVVGERGIGEFPDCFKSGKLLCQLVNKIRSDTIDTIHDRPISLLERENIRFYLEACEKLGVRKEDLFTLADLYEEKYLLAVVQNIYALAQVAERRSTWNGPNLKRPSLLKTSQNNS